MESGELPSPVQIKPSSRPKPLQRAVNVIPPQLREVLSRLSPIGTPDEPRIDMASVGQVRETRGYNELTARLKREKHPRPDVAAKNLEFVSTSGSAIETGIPHRPLAEGPTQHVRVDSSSDLSGEEVDTPRIMVAENTPAGLKKAGHQILEGGKWAVKNVEKFVGWVIRGNLEKRIRKIERHPERYESELRRELVRAFTDVITPEDPSFAARHRRTLNQASVTGFAALVPLELPTFGLLPAPIYSVGAGAVTVVNNFPNTWKAFREGRIRKGLVYSVMTGAGIITGVLPGLHHATNTF